MMREANRNQIVIDEEEIRSRQSDSDDVGVVDRMPTW